MLYLRAANGILFAGAPDNKVRQQAKAAAEANINVRVDEVAAGGEVTGARVREMLAGKLGVNVVVAGTVYGKVVGLELDTPLGGRRQSQRRGGSGNGRSRWQRYGRRDRLFWLGCYRLVSLNK